MEYTYNHSGWQKNLDQEGLLHRITSRIRQSLELDEILATTVAEVRAFLNTDRVKVYRFASDGSGEVIAESIHKQNLPSLVGLHFPADDIPKEAREMYLRARQRTIVDVVSGRIGVSPLVSPDTGRPVPNENVRYRTVDPCHVEYLKAMGVKSSLVVPIFNYGSKGQNKEPRLWGLLVSHHATPRTFLKRELRVLQLVADQVSIAIAQSNLLSQTRAEQQREATINKVTTLLHALPTIQLRAALEITIKAFAGCGGRLYIEPIQELYTWGDQPLLTKTSGIENNAIVSSPFYLEKHPVWQNWMYELKEYKYWTISDLYKEALLAPLANAFQNTKIRGMLVIPLKYRQEFIGVLSIFRNEYDTEILWAGKHEKNEKQHRPRLSFEEWRELKKGQSPEWKSEDILLAQALKHHFSMAIQQQLMYLQIRKMYSKVQALNNNLENQVQERTIKLQKSLSLAKILKQVSDQIRSSLDSKIILQTIVREVRKLLKADRVVIYKILSKLEGEVIVEDVGEQWRSIVGVKTPLGCFPDDYAELYYRGRTRAVNNVNTVDFSPCHQEFLENLQVQANVIVPINMGNELWGLLITHQCDAPRNWQDDEIELMQQLADQVSVAIGQAKLYENSCIAETEAKKQAEKAQKALYKLQQTQAHLIQSEKMSSLGQLVAGVAHEINNPVNFIYGNLTHAINYTEALLEILHLYQIHYPTPNSKIDELASEIDLEFIMEDLPKIMTSMQFGAERIHSIVLSLRNFSRLDEADRKAVNIHEGLDSTLVILEHRTKPAGYFPGIEIVREYADLPLVECYAGQLNQVFMNILANAIEAVTEGIEKQDLNTENISINEKHTQELQNSCSRELTKTVAHSATIPLNDTQPQMPKIIISTSLSRNKSDVIIRIADNGPGMKEEVQKKIFDPFFTTKPVGKGTGLGLAISYQIIVEKHNGIIKCLSQPSKGTEFYIQIPLKLPGGE